MAGAFKEDCHDCHDIIYVIAAFIANFDIDGKIAQITYVPWIVQETNIKVFMTWAAFIITILDCHVEKKKVPFLIIWISVD